MGTLSLNGGGRWDVREMIRDGDKVSGLSAWVHAAVSQAKQKNRRYQRAEFCFEYAQCKVSKGYWHVVH